MNAVLVPVECNGCEALQQALRRLDRTEIRLRSNESLLAVAMKRLSRIEPCTSPRKVALDADEQIKNLLGVLAQMESKVLRLNELLQRNGLAVPDDLKTVSIL